MMVCAMCRKDVPRSFTEFISCWSYLFVCVELWGLIFTKGMGFEKRIEKKCEIFLLRLLCVCAKNGICCW